MLPEVMEIVAGSGLRRQPAMLGGFQRRCLRGAVYPGLIPAAGERTEGVLWEGLDARMLERIDRFEGDLYERWVEAVELPSGASRDSFVYVLRPAEVGRAGPSAWDEEDFRARHLTAYLRGCRAFVRENA
jgi:gamma-glutamylcyclotransferase (GGCT)/AIG2-like uncharacterized protein YtfP